MNRTEDISIFRGVTDKDIEIFKRQYGLSTDAEAVIFVLGKIAEFRKNNHFFEVE